MSKTSVQILSKIKELIEAIVPTDYDFEVIKAVYEYPAQLIPVFPAITLELFNTERVDETLGDNRYVERYTVIIRAFINLIDSKENYSFLLTLERAIRDKIIANRLLTDYWRNSTLPFSEFFDAQIGESMCRSIRLTFTLEQTVLDTWS